MSDLIINSQNKLYIINNKALALKTYVKDGLVMWFDGIDKGSNGTVWVDKINGYEFTNHGAVFNSNNVYLDGTAYLDNSTVTTPLATNGTIEVVYEKESEFGTIFSPAYTGSSLCGYSLVSGNVILWSTRTNRLRYLNNPRKASVSISLARALANGTALTQNSQNNITQGSGDIAYIGRRPNGQYFTGKIYCIRIYNRQLTEEEVLANCAVDYQRFNFDFNEYITFADPVTEQICVSNWGDEIGLTKGAAMIVPTSQVTSAFSGNTNITSFDEFKYFEGITEIPANQFNACSSLESITLPSSVLRIYAAFKDCTSLKKIEIPAGVSFSQGGSFANDTALEEITFRGPATFSLYTFQGCSNLKRVNIPDLTTWFSFVHSQTQTVGQYSNEVHLYLIGNNTEITDMIIPNSVTTIKSFACFNCKGITSLTIPSSVTTIESNAFAGCSGLTGTVIIPSSVTSIGGNAFSECLSITNLIIESTETIASNIGGTTIANTVGDGTGTFHHYGSMTNNSNWALNFREIIIDGNFSNTANYALRFVSANNTSTFETMKIGGNYSTAGTSALNCRPVQGLNNLNEAGQKYNLLEIMGTITSNYCILGADNVNSLAYGFVLHLGYDVVANNAFPCTPEIAGASFNRVALICVGKGESAAEDDSILVRYLNDPSWSQYRVKLDTWYNFLHPSIITFNDSEVESICVNNWGNGTTINTSQAARVANVNYIFQNNTDVSTFDEFSYFKGVRSMAGLFSGSSITKVTFPKGLRPTNSTGSWSAVFYDCASLEEVDFSDCVRDPSSYNTQLQWFTRCSSLTTLHFESLEQLNNFSRQTIYTTSDVPFNANDDTHYVYINGTELRNLVIPNTITQINVCAFYRFNRITSVTFPSTLTDIGERAFFGCSGLTSLTLPSSITNIGSYAFAETNIAGELQLPSSLTNIGSFAFDNLTGITGTLNVPATTTCGDQCFSRMSGITNLIFNGDTTSRPFRHSDGIGNGTGVATFHGNLTHEYGSCCLHFKKVIIDGNYTKSLNEGFRGLEIVQIRIGGNVNISVTQSAHSGLMNVNGSNISFVEIMGTIESNYGNMFNTYAQCANAFILHLGYDTVTNNALPCTPNIVSAGGSRVFKIYVGDGSSAAHDNAILAQYNSDTDWSAYSSKLDTWYNYINSADANPDYIN